MSTADRDLVMHLSKQVQINADLAYLIGPGSRTWELLITAIAGITGEGDSNADIRCRSVLARQNSYSLLNRALAMPDLLGSCENWVTWWDMTHEPGADGAAEYEAKMLDAMRAAIAKAKGGAA